MQVCGNSEGFLRKIVHEVWVGSIMTPDGAL